MDPAYFLHVTGGEFRSLSRSKSIDRVLAAGKVDSETARKLRLVQQVRIYARDRVGLSVGSAYSRYEDIAGEPVAYAVSGAHQDRLEPYKWVYPIIGGYEAKGFFKRELAEKEAERLRRKGFDADIGEVAGFSTMGILPDPIRSSNLEESDVDLAILVFHELTHNTIFKPDDTQFNESMATFVGRAAAEQFFVKTYGEDSAEAKAARTHLADLQVVDSYVSDLYQRLSALYGQSISRDEKLKQREPIFANQRQRWSEVYKQQLHEAAPSDPVTEVATNNATALAAYRYHSDLSLYREVLAKSGGDFRAMIAVLKKAAAKKDSFGYLRSWTATGRRA
jgi:predicted aminopeptidase